MARCPNAWCLGEVRHRADGQLPFCDQCQSETLARVGLHPAELRGERKDLVLREIAVSRYAAEYGEPTPQEQQHAAADALSAFFAGEVANVNEWVNYRADVARRYGERRAEAVRAARLAEQQRERARLEREAASTRTQRWAAKPDVERYRPTRWHRVLRCLSCGRTPEPGTRSGHCLACGGSWVVDED